jgi:hypothetical protein
MEVVERAYIPDVVLAARYYKGEGLAGRLWHLFLPSLVIALTTAAIVMRNLRSSILAVLKIVFANVPSPIWPCGLYPHAQSVPSCFMAMQKPSPAPMALTPVKYPGVSPGAST